MNTEMTATQIPLPTQEPEIERRHQELIEALKNIAKALIYIGNVIEDKPY